MEPGVHRPEKAPVGPPPAEATGETTTDEATGDAGGASDDPGSAPSNASSWAMRLCGAVWAAGLVVWLLVVAVGAPRLLLAAGAGGMALIGSVFGQGWPAHWATWTLRGGLSFVLAVALLLPYARPLYPNEHLLAAGLVKWRT